MKIAPATLTIASSTFRTGERVTTPRGAGTIIGLDPFGDEEIGVRLDDAPLVWFSFLDVMVVDEEPAS